MALPNVTIQYQNGGLGLVANPDDRVCGIIFNAPGFTLPLNTPKQLFSTDDIKTLIPDDGIYGSEIRRQVADFYRVAGTGAELWIMLTFAAATTAEIFTVGYAQTLLDAAEGRINVLAVSRFRAPDETAVTMLDGLDADVLNGMDEAQALAVDNANRHMPVRIILDGRNMVGLPATVRNLKAQTFNRVAINVASNVEGAVNACQGLLLGRIASIPPNRSIGRVKDGSVPISAGYLTNGQRVETYGIQATALHNKGYIFLRKFSGKAGYYWNDDHMATADTDDFYSLANGRVIDKAARIAYATFIEELMDEVLVDEKGKVLKTTLKQYQARIERAIGLSMAANNEISTVEAFVDPNQDIIATSQLVIDLRITPTGTNRVILVKLGLFNPNAAL